MLGTRTMTKTIGALLLCSIAVSTASAQGLARAPVEDAAASVLSARAAVAAPLDPSSPEAEPFDLPPALDVEGGDAACPFHPGDPFRLVHMLGVAGPDALRTEAPHRLAQARLCAP